MQSWQIGLTWQSLGKNLLRISVIITIVLGFRYFSDHEDYSSLNKPNTINLTIIENWSGITDRASLSLTASERRRLENRPIRYCVDPLWLPVDFINDAGAHKGIAALYIDAFEAVIGKRFEFVRTESRQASFHRLKAETCDLLPLAMNRPAETDWLAVTQPYFNKEIALATRQSAPYIDNFSLLNQQTIGVLSGSAVETVIQERVKPDGLVRFDSIKSGLRAVEAGEIFGFADITPVLAYNISELGYSLKISGNLNERIELGIAVSTGDEELLSIMQKTLDAIDPNSIYSIANTYSNLIKEKKIIDYQVIGLISTISILLLLFLAYRQRETMRINNEYRQFIDTINHEYRTPLASLRTHIDVLQTESLIDPETEQQINREMLRLQELFTDSLSPDRLSVLAQFEKRLIDFTDLTERCIDELVYRYPECPIDYMQTQQAIQIQGDDLQLSVAIRNLLQNAAKYRTPKNQNTVVSIKLTSDAKNVKLAICNPLEKPVIDQPKKLFARFVRGSNNQGESGIGLGLYLAQKVILSHKGKITLQQTEDRRFCATVRLPKT